MSPRPIAPRVAYVVEQMLTDVGRWIVHTLLPTLAATMLGLTLWAVGVAALGLSLMGCATAPETPTPTTAAEPACFTLVHATCAHYAECDDENPRPAPELYAECLDYLASNVFDGRLCVDPGARFTGPVNLCAAELLQCADVATVELVCGSVGVVRK